jgi:hypothetical protein
MAEQPVNLSTVLYLGVFSRAEQRVLQAIFKAIAEGNGRCVATLAMLARDSNTSKSTTRNANRPRVAIGLLKDRAPLLLPCLASQHFDLRESAHGSAPESNP